MSFLPRLQSTLTLLLSTSLLIATVGCPSRPARIDAESVKVSRDQPAADCSEIGRVQGSVATNKGTAEQAMEDMKKDAAGKGGNYVMMEMTSALGTSVNGTAYYCR